MAQQSSKPIGFVQRELDILKLDLGDSVVEESQNDNNQLAAGEATDAHVPSAAPIGENLEHTPNGSSGGFGTSLSKPGELRNQLDPSDGSAEITEGSPRDSVAELVESTLATLTTSGPIPSSSELYEYTPEHQERILRMAESSRTDESDRRTYIVKAHTRIAWATMTIQAILFLSSIAAAAILFFLTNNPYSMLFLGVPVTQAIGQFSKYLGRRSDDEE